MAGDRIELTVPARPGFARMVRVTAATLASRLGMSVDEVDDVRIAIEEAFLLASARTPADGTVRLVFDVDETGIEVLVGPMTAGRANDEDEETGERYARFILESVCDEFELTTTGAHCHARLVKRVGSQA